MEWKNNHAIVYPTVDCAIFESAKLDRIYLARKPNQFKWRFVGGFVDPSDNSYQDAAKREAKEETNLTCDVIGFVTSAKVDDERYQNKEDKIITTLFALVPYGRRDAIASDDISQVRVFNVSDVFEEILVPEHRLLWRKLVDWLNNLTLSTKMV